MEKKIYVKPVISEKATAAVVLSLACSNGARSHCLRS